MNRTTWLAQLIGLPMVSLLVIACRAAPPTPTAMLILPTPTIAPAAATSTPAAAAPAEFVWELTGEPNPFSNPVGIALDAEGNIYVLDVGNSRVQKFDRNGEFLLMWGTAGSGDGQFQISKIDDGSVALDTEGNVYVGDVDNYRIQKFDRNGNFLLKWGAPGVDEGQFSEIADIAIDKQNSVYVSDWGSSTIQKFDPNGRLLLRWAPRGPLDSQPIQPTSLAIDGQGNLLVYYEVGRLQKFDGKGHFLLEYSLPQVADRPMGIGTVAADGQGDIYIGDIYAHRIVKLDRNGKFLTVWGSQGVGEGQFDRIQRIAVDNEGYVYVTDWFNNRVQRFRQPSYRP
jgi:tripartite motif-containing protein 71